MSTFDHMVFRSAPMRPFMVLFGDIIQRRASNHWNKNNRSKLLVFTETSRSIPLLCRPRNAKQLLKTRDASAR